MNVSVSQLLAGMVAAGLTGAGIVYAMRPPAAAGRPVRRWIARLLLQARSHAGDAAVRLATSEQRFKDFAEASSDWFWEMGPDLRFTFMSDRIYDVLGFDPGHTLGKRREELSDTSIEPEKWAKHFADLAAHRPFREFTYQIILPNGNTRHISVSGKPLFEDSGRFLGYRGIGRDVTERLDAEERLRKSETRFRDFAESSTDWLWEQDAELRFTFLSHGALERFGLSREQLIGRRREETAPLGVTNEQWRSHLDDLAAHRPFRDFRMCRLGADNRHRWCTINGWPTFDHDGRFTGYRGTGRDITNEVEAEHRANVAQRRLSAAVEGLSDGLAIFDVDDRLVACNEAFRRMMLPPDLPAAPGTPFEDLLRAAVSAGLIPDAADDPEGYIRARLERHRRPSSVVQRRLLDASWIQVREQRLSDGGIVLIATDVTEIKRQQAEVERKTATLEATFANMNEGVSVYDRDLNLVVANGRWQEMLQVPDHLARPGIAFREILRHMASQGHFSDEDTESAIERRLAAVRKNAPGRRARWYPNGRYIDLRRTPMPDGGFISVRTDLTELKATEERFKDFAEATSDWFWEANADLRFTYVSPMAREKAGVAAGIDIGDTSTMKKPRGVTDERWFSQLADIKARRAFRDLHIQRSDAEGRVRTLAISGKPIFDGKGVFQGYRGTGTDITERLEIEARAHLAQVRFGSAIDSLDDALAIFDTDDRLVMCNRAYRREVGEPGGSITAGMTFEEIVRLNLSAGKLTSVVDQEAFMAQRLTHHRNPGEPIQLQRDDGTWLQVREQRLSDGGTAVIGTDITATKNRERELFEKSEILERTLANMGEGIIVFDRDLRLLAWNQRAIELLELPPALCRAGLRYEDYLRFQAEHGEFANEEPEAAVAKRIARAGSAQPYQVGRWRPNGRFIELRRNPMPGGGFVTLYSDATERRRAEDALRDAKEAAEIANRTKSAFLANMSHELRTPLNAIIGFSEIIEQELFGTIGSPRYKEYARDIHDSGTHLLNLINDILDVSKAEAGKIELQESSVRIGDVIDASIRLVGPRAREGGIKLSLPQYAHLPPLLADERRLKQVLLNLLSNAVKFTPSGGSVTLTANDEGAGGFVIRVIDSGIGMAGEDIPKALEPFGQVDSKLARKYEGTGLGLPLSKALVELHGGSLQIESEPGVGTTVTVVFPASRVVRQDSGGRIRQFRRKTS